MKKVKLKARRDTWGDARVTVYESEDGKLYVEFVTVNDDDQLVGCYPQLVPYSDNPVHEGDYVALIDKKTPLRYPQVQIDFNNRPRVASDWLHLHSIDTLRERTERPPEEIRGYIEGTSHVETYVSQ